MQRGKKRHHDQTPINEDVRCYWPEALVACAGVTVSAVATAMGVKLRGGRVVAEGHWDARGTLGVDREAPVGLTDIALTFELDTGPAVTSAGAALCCSWQSDGRGWQHLTPATLQAGLPCIWERASLRDPASFAESPLTVNRKKETVMEDHRNGNKITRTETQASGGSKEGVVRYVLIGGLVLVVIALVVVYVFA
jgi:OsmC-like protein